jgi:putative zinc finger/helix-turn-helix YgiT family protein
MDTLLLYCAECKSGRLRERVVKERLNVSGVTFTQNIQASLCRKCGADYITHEDLGRFELAVSGWLGSHGVRAPESFKFIRKALGLKAADLAARLDLTPETVSRWENGRGSIDEGAFAVLRGLVADRIAGSDQTVTMLRAIRSTV